MGIADDAGAEARVLEPWIPVRGYHREPLPDPENRLPRSRRPGFRQDDGELTGAIADHEVGQPQLPPEYVRHIAFQPFSRLRTEARAYSIQFVDAQQNKAEAERVPAGSLELLAYPAIERV
jgi:hypothetical protein